jgi:hypothetical protein
MDTRNKVVARHKDGRTVKGYTFDFMPQKASFHVVDPVDEKRATTVNVAELKAVFYVKDFSGDRARLKSHKRAEEAARRAAGLKMKISFRDGEVLFGTSMGYSRGRSGFFVTPSDPASNNERAFVLAEATTGIETWR